MAKRNPKSLDLDVDAPDKVSGVLRAAADKFYESANELESAWQDKGAGAIWSLIADVLGQAADEIDGLDPSDYDDDTGDDDYDEDDY